jgi:hypothetical protein
MWSCVVNGCGHPSLRFLPVFSPLQPRNRALEEGICLFANCSASLLLLSTCRNTIHLRHRSGAPTPQRRNISCSFDCTIILRRAFTNALATHNGKRDTSETYRLKRVAIYRKTLQHSTRSPYQLNRTSHNSQWQSSVSFLRTGTLCWPKSARPVVRPILRDAPTTARPFANCARVIDEILVERRCLGQTELKVKPGQIGTSNATKPDNLGVLDYAHLRVPLPSDLSSSGIFIKGPNRKYPEAYFLMVWKCAGKRVEDFGTNTRTEAIKRRIHQCYRHVQGSFPVRVSGGGSQREGVHQVIP